MSAIDRILNPSENVIQRARLHWIVFLKPVLFAVIGLIVFSMPGNENLGQFSGIFFVFFVLPYTASVTLTWLFSEVVVTDQRFIAKIGLSRYSLTEAAFHKIKVADVERGPLGALFDLGAIAVEFAGGTIKRFGSISSPDALGQALEQQIALAKRKPS